MAPRAIIIIEEDNPRIAHICLLPVGPGCEIPITPGQRVNNRDELGMFHLPGSSTCMIFKKETDVMFDIEECRGDVLLDDAKPI